MRQEVFCRNNGGLEKLIARGHFTAFPLPHYHLRVLSFTEYLSFSSMFLIGVRCFFRLEFE